MTLLLIRILLQLQSHLVLLNAAGDLLSVTFLVWIYRLNSQHVPSLLYVHVFKVHNSHNMPTLISHSLELLSLFRMVDQSMSLRESTET